MSSNGNNNTNNEGNNSNKKLPKFNFGNRAALISFLILLGFFLFFLVFQNRDFINEISYTDFLKDLKAGKISAVKILNDRIILGTYGTYKDERISEFRTVIPYNDENLMSDLIDSGVRIEGGNITRSPIEIFFDLLPWVIGFLFIWFMFRQVQGSGNKAFSFGKSRAKRYLDTGKKITFADVAGQKEAKYELQEVVEFLKNPGKFVKIGAKIPTGVLLVGLPGTGKTLLAKAIAGEANVAFFHMSGSDFVEMFVGVGASRVRDLFDQGRKNAPCILFIDELDAVGRTRGAGYGGGHDEREQTLNQMLVEMDGFDTKDGVIILAATNRPDVLDPALLRPGRFDRQVVIDMPDINEREDILKIHCRKIPTSSGIDFKKLARATPGTSGADLANMVNEAALFAARKNKQKVEMQDFEEARDKILMGIAKKSKIIPPKERKMTAYHESGHAILHFLLQNVDPLHKVTIIPHGRALGMSLSLPEQDTYSRSKAWLIDSITIRMGGYAAEKLIYNETTTGSQADIEQATAIARRMVCEWGMSDDLGPIAFGQKDEPIFLGKEIARHKEYSEETARKIDDEIESIVTTCLNQAQMMLRDNKDKLTLLAETLVVRETLDGEEVSELLGFEYKRAVE
ncbi:MAG: ATP-dependent zinc metalloprotease FtsH [Spirochaetales bacterium]|nr:ATP-dependent zinc metalloprotease FtsH [Spirochaetales bacterium]